MGNAADAILNGVLCERCGCLIDGDEPGYPRLCRGCELWEKRDIERERKESRGDA